MDALVDRKQHCTFYMEEEVWEVVYRMVIDGKSERNRMNMRSKFRLHPHIAKSVGSIFLFEFTIKSAMKLVVEPAVTVDLSFCSDADTCPCSCFSLFFLSLAGCWG